MLMVIFGAGASYDSDPARAASPDIASNREDDRPPLANQLFDNRGEFPLDLARFPQCRPIVPYLRQTTAIEQQLERLQTEVTASPPYAERLRQLAAVRWYFQLMLSGCDQRWYDQARGITNYLTLLDQILRWGHSDVLLVTFNYDRLLEFAITDRTGHRFTRVEDYSQSPFPLVKLHGSADWGRVVKNPPIIADETWRHVHTFIDNAGSLEVTAEYVVSGDRPLWRDTSARPLFPAIAIPVQSKQQFECPSEHLTMLRERLPRVRKLLIVGWRGMDQHFINLLREHGLRPDRAHVVSSSAADATSVIQTLHENGLASEHSFEAQRHRFSGYVIDRMGDGLLRP